MSDDPDLDPEICKQFFEENVFKLDASKLNEHGLRYVLCKTSEDLSTLLLSSIIKRMQCCNTSKAFF